MNSITLINKTINLTKNTKVQGLKRLKKNFMNEMKMITYPNPNVKNVFYIQV